MNTQNKHTPKLRDILTRGGKAIISGADPVGHLSRAIAGLVHGPKGVLTLAECAVMRGKVGRTSRRLLRSGKYTGAERLNPVSGRWERTEGGAS